MRDIYYLVAQQKLHVVCTWQTSFGTLDIFWIFLWAYFILSFFVHCKWVFPPRTGQEGRFLPGVWFGFGNTRLQSVYTKPNLIHHQIHKLRGATLFARNPPYHLHECPSLLAHSLDTYHRTKYRMISVNFWVETQSPRKWYLNHSLNIFIIQDFYCDYFVLADIFTTGGIFESFIGNIQYSEHEVHYIHVNVKCLEDAFTTRLTLGFVTR